MDLGISQWIIIIYLLPFLIFCWIKSLTPLVINLKSQLSIAEMIRRLDIFYSMFITIIKGCLYEIVILNILLVPEDRNF